MYDEGKRVQVANATCFGDEKKQVQQRNGIRPEVERLRGVV